MSQKKISYTQFTFIPEKEKQHNKSEKNKTVYFSKREKGFSFFKTEQKTK